MTNNEVKEETIVVKFGGNAMAGKDLEESFAQDIAFLAKDGARVVVVHGGGPQINEHLDRLGIESSFTGGFRVTTPEVLDVVRMVLTGRVQRDLVNMINNRGLLAVGISGEDARLIQAKKRTTDVKGHAVDIGLVGEVTAVEPGVIFALLDHGSIPVVSSIGVADDGGPLNLNADSAASALASALKADRLVLLTDVEGYYSDRRDETSKVDLITETELEELMSSLEGGMAPKMEACLHAVKSGVGVAQIIDGRQPHALLLAVDDEANFGTKVVAS